VDKAIATASALTGAQAGIAIVYIAIVTLLAGTDDPIPTMCFELAGSRAAVATHDVAIITLLTRFYLPITTDRTRGLHPHAAPLGFQTHCGNPLPRLHIS
jgi:hypothetical protein